jgi:microcystin degradation protein MlrC
MAGSGVITAVRLLHLSVQVDRAQSMHIDVTLAVCTLIHRAMQKEIIPRTIIAKRPLLRGLDGGRTHEGSPMKTLIDRGTEFEASGEEGVLVVSICAGFSAADIYDIGPSVTVTYDASKDATHRQEHAQEVADEFMNYAWATRNYSSVNHQSVADAVAKAKAREEQSVFSAATRPLVMADVTDNPGSGHYGDTTNLLREMISASLQHAVFYAIYDPEAVQQGIAIGVGRTGSITLGGKHDPTCGGPPLTLEGKVVTISDGCFPAYGPMGNSVWQNFGLSLLFRVGGVDIIVISNNGQLLDLAQITSLGCDPVHTRTIAVKSNHHFRASLGPIADEIITVDGGGLGSIILKCGNYQNVRRPIWPLDLLDFDA